MAQSASAQPTVTATRVPPGPRGNWFTGSMEDFRKDALNFFTRVAREHGDVAGVRFGPRTVYCLVHPEHYKQVLQERNRNYVKNKFVIEAVRFASGENLFTSDGEYWLRQRRMMQPAFHRQRIATWGKLMTDAAEAAAKRWAAAPAGQIFMINEEMMRVTLRVVGQALFSQDLSANHYGPAFEVTGGFVNHRLNTLFPMPLVVPTRRNRDFKRAKRAIDAAVDALIVARRAGPPGQYGDLLDLLIEACDAGTGMTNLELRNEIVTMIFAGHETTANTLTWTFHLLGQNPQAEAALHAELDRVLGQRVPTVEDLPNLPYTRMVIDESLRLYPPAWAISRNSIGPDEIGGYAIPAGSPVNLTPYVTHRDSRWWDEPERFDPERFMPERAAGRPAYAYIPFGGGPRQCIGNIFALTEAQLVLATLAQRFRLRVVPGHTVKPVPIFVLKTEHGLPMTLSAR